MANLKAGILRHRLVLQRPIESQDTDTGAIIVNWLDIATIWAAIIPLSAREFIAAQAEDSKVNTRITIRYRNDVTAKMRLYHASKDMYYNIEGVLADKDSGLEYLTLPCSTGIRFDEGDPSAVIPVVLEYPAISGNHEIGQTLTSSTGLWANDPVSYSYQWYVNDVSVVGATSSTWIIDAEIDDIVTVGVVSSNSAGNGVEAFSDGVLVSA